MASFPAYRGPPGSAPASSPRTGRPTRSAAEEPVRLLAADAALAATIDQRLLPKLRETLTVPSVSVRPGRWSPTSLPVHPLGFLVLDGLLIRQVQLVSHRSCELLSSGDLFYPSQDHSHSALNAVVRWRVLTRTTLAVLDHDFTAWVQRVPSLHAALMDRSLGRVSALALILAMAREPRLEVRLLSLLRYLVDKIGTPTHDGSLVDVRVSQETLGEMMAASRARTCSALRCLEERAIIERRGRGRILIRAEHC